MSHPSEALAIVPSGIAQTRCGEWANTRSDRGQRTAAGDKTASYLKENDVLYTIAVVLIALWLLGLVSSYTIGGFIHILLVIAVVMILVQVIQGRRV